jgi:hypothetical protein
VTVNGQTYESISPKTTKIQAEQEAASIALLSLTDQTPNITSIVLIDLVNKPAYDMIPNQNMLYIGFITTNHHSRSKYNHWLNIKSDDLTQTIIENKTNLYIVEIDSDIQDVIDHLMTMYIHSIITLIEREKKINTIVIVFNDHAGYCAKSCIELYMSWRKINGLTIKLSPTLP